MHEQGDIEVFEQTYQCEHGHIMEEHKLVAIRLTDRYILKCPACGTEELRCIGDNR